jgi:hypothetical protein
MTTVPFMRPDQREYVEAMFARQRKCNADATEASNLWQQRSAWLDAYCDRNNYNENSKRDKRKLDWALNDAYDKWSWNEREARRCHDAIQSVWLMIQLTGNAPAAPSAYRKAYGQLFEQREPTP